MPDDDIDGCDIDRAVNLTDDGDIDDIALYADVDFTDRAAVLRRAREWRQLFPTVR